MSKENDTPARLLLEVTLEGIEMSVSTLEGGVLRSELIEMEAICKGGYMVDRDVAMESAHMGIESALEDVMFHAVRLCREFWEASDE